jgi:hypothetical protein
MAEKNMFEQFRDKELPEEIQESVESSASYGKTEQEYWFRAGFFTAKKIKEIRKIRGID